MYSRHFKLVVLCILVTALIILTKIPVLAEEPSTLDMKTWVEIKSGPLNVRTCPSTSCSVITDENRPYLVGKLPVGSRIKVLEQESAKDQSGCIEGNCIWLHLDEGYIHSSFVEEIPPPLPLDFVCPGQAEKCIVVDTQHQSAHIIKNGKDIFRTWVSTGKAQIFYGYATPKGIHRVIWRTNMQRMSGGTPGTRSYYNLPGVCKVAYFTSRGDALHAAYWHAFFGQPMSHGCVNMTYYDAGVVFMSTPVGTYVVVL